MVLGIVDGQEFAAGGLETVVARLRLCLRLRVRYLDHCELRSGQGGGCGGDRLEVVLFEEKLDVQLVDRIFELRQPEDERADNSRLAVRRHEDRVDRQIGVGDGPRLGVSDLSDPWISHGRPVRLQPVYQGGKIEESCHTDQRDSRGKRCHKCADGDHADHHGHGHELSPGYGLAGG